MVLAAAIALLFVGCADQIERVPRRPSSTSLANSSGIAQIMRGTVGAEALIVGYQSVESPTYRPLIVQGYGLVVGLNGTGSRDISPDLRAHMLTEMAQGGIGSEGTGFGHISPAAMLDSMDTAVVMVQGVVPLGSKKGTAFDVRVFPVPNTSTTSLEGGILYTTELHTDLNVGRVDSRTFAMARARGTIFINPFVEPNAAGRDAIDRRNGRILNGGAVADDMPIKLRVVNPSHSRAGMLVTAINTRFPLERGQFSPTARGESDESIELTVPPSYSTQVDEFVELLLHTTIRQANPESVATSIRRILEANTTAQNMITAAWRWQALGTRCFPIIRDLYDSPVERLRSAALGAGAKLNDPLAVPHLADLALTGSTPVRLQAIRLMENMGLNPEVDNTLRKLLNADDATVRIEAYEMLAKRRDPMIGHMPVDQKFLVDIVPSDNPMIYVTQIGLPRIALFGNDLAINRPIFMQAWSNRLMVTGDSDKEYVEVFYRPPGFDEGFVSRVNPELEEFIRFLGHTSTVDEPASGSGLTYGETVGALFQIVNQEYIICSSSYAKADFRFQQDRIQAAFAAQQEEERNVERPEFAQPPIREDANAETTPPGPAPAPDLTRPVSSPGTRFP
jgi:hypothetical protein